MVQDNFDIATQASSKLPNQTPLRTMSDRSIDVPSLPVSRLALGQWKGQGVSQGREQQAKDPLTPRDPEDLTERALISHGEVLHAPDTETLPLHWKDPGANLNQPPGIVADTPAR